VEDSPSHQAEHDEDKQQRSVDRRDDGEIDGDHLAAVVLKKRPQPCAGDCFGVPGKYFDTVDSATSIPTLSNSP